MAVVPEFHEKATYLTNSSILGAYSESIRGTVDDLSSLLAEIPKSVYHWGRSTTRDKIFEILKDVYHWAPSTTRREP